MNAKFNLALALAAIVTLTGCPKSRTAGGFFVETTDSTRVGSELVFIVHPNVLVSGDWLRDLASNAVGDELNFTVITDADGVVHIPDGRLPAVWRSGVAWNVPCGSIISVDDVNVTFENPNISWTCFHGASPPPDPAFSTTNFPPSTLTVKGSSLSAQYGMPRLQVYNPINQLAAQIYASQVAPDGTSATFSFPRQSSGTPLGEAFYGFNVWNQDSPGSFRHAGVGFFSVGRNDTSQPSPFGVDAVDFDEWIEHCDYIPPDPWPVMNVATMADGEGGWTCNYSNSVVPTPVLTLSNTNELSYRGLRLAVGSYPTAVKAYRIESTTVQYGDGSTWYENVTITQPSRAIVANYLGSSLSFVDLANGFTITTIAVGSQPAALTINAAETRAWVANYGSGTVSEVDLLSMSVVRSTYVGTGPSALTFDPVANQLWVGGQNFIATFDPATMSVIRSMTANGPVTSMALSQGQGSLVYTQVSSQTFSAQQVRLSDSAPIGNYGSEPIGGYQAPPGGGGGFAVQLLANGTVVSANYGNSIAVSATPSGFVVMDLVKRTEVMRGTTPSSVRAIATNPGQGIVYLTAPASNALITVPLPKAPQ